MTTRITNSYSSAVYNSSRTTKQAADKASKATASSSKKSSSNVIRTNSSNATSVSSKSTAKKTNAASSTKSTVNKNKKTNITTSSSNASGKNVKKTNSALSKATSTTKSGGTRTTVNTARVSSISRSKPNSSVTSKMTRSEKAEQIRISYAVAALAARNAGIKTDIYGRPLINNGDESRRYAEQYNKLKGSEGRIMAAKAAGIDVYANGEPKITSKHDYEAYQKKIRVITATALMNNSNLSIDCPLQYRYDQSIAYDSDNPDKTYGNTNASSSCATFALATALSIHRGYQITPDKIDTHSDTDGQGTNFASHGAHYIECSTDEAFHAIDRELSLGNPVLIHTSGKDKNGNDSEHWATVIGKGESNYTIIDPWGGRECSLDEMQIYRNGGEILGYASIS